MQIAQQRFYPSAIPKLTCEAAWTKRIEEKLPCQNKQGNKCMN
ncbi:hypothetical protein MAMP_00680 [Methylophaga aminisulfidivorans MP]|uniref:Uncharacterized protein n=1 Tax=Methylophaga aminisulfidivorans MP TaxID=1026882 RepID=F5SYT2_9GAMM|nr:hypothetical protein MAMP_00680 [Methylophaga aminisulfidivorans MP]